MLVRVDGRARLLAVRPGSGALSDWPGTVLPLATQVSETELPVDAALAARACRLASAWIERRSSRRLVAAVGPGTVKLQRRLLARLVRIGRSAPLHERARLAPLLAGARRALAVPHDAGTERVLRDLADAPLPDDAWLRALSEFGALHAARDAASDETGGVIALLLIC